MTDAAPETAAAIDGKRRRGGSLTQRMIGIAALWIAVLLLLGGYALDRVLSRSIVVEFRCPARICPQRDDRGVGDRPRRRGAFLARARRPALSRALFGGLFPDIGPGQRDFPSRSLWDRKLKIDRSHDDKQLHKRDSNEFEGEPLRILERDVESARFDGPLALPSGAIAR